MSHDMYQSHYPECVNCLIPKPCPNCDAPKFPDPITDVVGTHFPVDIYTETQPYDVAFDISNYENDSSPDYSVESELSDDVDFPYTVQDLDEIQKSWESIAPQQSNESDIPPDPLSVIETVEVSHGTSYLEPHDGSPGIDNGSSAYLTESPGPVDPARWRQIGEPEADSRVINQPSEVSSDTSVPTERTSGSRSSDILRPEESADPGRHKVKCGICCDALAADNGLCNVCAAQVRSGERSQASRHSEAYLVTDYREANRPDRRGDGLDGDEIIMHGFLKAHGMVGESRYRDNSVLLLPVDEHRNLWSVQQEKGLHDPEYLASLSLSELLSLNTQCMLEAGLPKERIKAVLEYAMEQVPALVEAGVPYWPKY